jgi:hypothetical protein
MGRLTGDAAGQVAVLGKPLLYVTLCWCCRHTALARTPDVVGD